MFELVPLQFLVVMVLFALGLSAIITGSKIGYPIRFLWCYLTKDWARWSWPMVRCPYCNAFWAGVVVAVFTIQESCLIWVFQVLQVAITSCGAVRVIQAALGGDGIAMTEDFESTFEQEDNRGN